MNAFPNLPRNPHVSAGKLAAIALMLGSLAVGSANAAIVNLTFTGTYDIGGDTVFGLSGPAIPYSFQITYDTALDTNTEYYAAGAAMRTQTTTHEWYGYSASGVTATSLAFGTQTWSSGDLVWIVVEPKLGIGADLWFDKDISLATPTLSWMVFSTDGGDLQLGDATTGSINIAMDPGVSEVYDYDTDDYGFSNNMIISSNIVGQVPEPATLFLFGAGLAGLVFRQGNRAMSL